MKNILFFFAFFLPVFLFSQNQGQVPVGGLSYAPDSNYVIYSQFYKGRNGVAMWVNKDSIDFVPLFDPTKLVYAGQDGKLTDNSPMIYADEPFQFSTRKTFQTDRVYVSSANSNPIYRAHKLAGGFNPTYTWEHENLRSWLVDMPISGHSTNGLSFRWYPLGSLSGGNFSPNYTFLSLVPDGTAGDGTIELWKNITLYAYGNARDDSGSFSPDNFLYSSSSSMKRAPFSSGIVTNPATLTNSSIQTALNSIYSAATTGVNFYNSDGSLSANRTVTGASNNLAFTGMGNITATGSGSATYRFNLYPHSSLPSLLEQTSAGDTANVQLQASLGRATVRATEDIYLQAATAVYAEPLEGSSTGIVSARPDGELIRREEAFFNASFVSHSFTVAVSPTVLSATFTDNISPGFTVSGDSIIYAGIDTAYFSIGFFTENEFLESAIGTYSLSLYLYKNGIQITPSKTDHLVYYTALETEPVQTIAKEVFIQLMTGDVLKVRQSGTAGIGAELHNFSFTGQKLN